MCLQSPSKIHTFVNIEDLLTESRSGCRHCERDVFWRRRDGGMMTWMECGSQPTDLGEELQPYGTVGLGLLIDNA